MGRAGPIRQAKKNMKWVNVKGNPGLCSVDENGEAEIPVWNVAIELLVLKAFQEIGEWENNVKKGQQMLNNLLRKNREGCDGSTSGLWELVKEYNAVFAVEGRELTQTNLVGHEIDTGDTELIRQTTRPVPLGARLKVKKMIRELLDRGIRYL
ncbi:unnamed protein product [Heligmosomoides polygyrus]|uniref:Gag-pol polyprotein n=1 Tax=Heligmosomoides polygyrus TaxID=6339 RepID=A0A183GFE5_HELPZ|nr:unnamed protein product [Heligmosomoides polygyrus]